MTRQRPRGALFTLRREIVVPAPCSEVFAFFGSAENLDQITPPFLRFRVLTPKPIEMRVGTRIAYAIRLHGIPLRWESEIIVWEPPHRFVDLQIRGPYRWWHHEHRFEQLGKSTRVIDEVDYACLGGRLVHSLLVKRDLNRIFDFRTRSLLAIFSPEHGAQQSPGEAAHT